MDNGSNVDCKEESEFNLEDTQVKKEEIIEEVVVEEKSEEQPQAGGRMNIAVVGNNPLSR